MKLLSRLKELFSDPCDDVDPVVALIMAALDSSRIREDLRGILAQEPFHRTSLLNSMADEMSLQGKDPQLVYSIRRLCDPTLADAVLHYLTTSGN